MTMQLYLVCFAGTFYLDLRRMLSNVISVALVEELEVLPLFSSHLQ